MNGDRYRWIWIITALTVLFLLVASELIGDKGDKYGVSESLQEGDK